MSDKQQIKFEYGAYNPRLNEILNPEENLAKQKELTQKAREPFKHPDQAILDNTEMAVGKPLAPNDFIRLLKVAGPNLLIEDGGVPGAMAVRVRTLDDDPLSPTYKQFVKKYVTGFYADRVLPEFSSFINDSTGVPVREVRGWRTVLIMLRSEIKYSEMTRVFGEPVGERAILWNRVMREHRL